MRKFLKVTSIIVIIIALICLANELGILSFFDLNISEEQLARYSEYYFSQLELDEKEMYVAIDEAIKDRKKDVFLGTQKTSEITEKINRVITAYFYDNPEYYYISNEYTVYTRDFKLFAYCTVEFKYIVDIDTEIDAKNQELEAAIDKLLSENVRDDMTDFEKEVAIHDALAKNVVYYDYEDIDSIPTIKHSAYGALVEKEAVCDGYAKAFKLLLERVGIESIIANGVTDNVAHAWNIVELEGKYYNVDVTSDKLQSETGEYAIHSYFNITDEQISKTHTLNKMFNVPECSATQHYYYTQKDYYVTDEDNLYKKLYDIVLKQQDSNILEVKVSGEYSVRRIVDVLYELNFNDWRYTGKTNVQYHNIEDVYIFIKY